MRCILLLDPKNIHICALNYRLPVWKRRLHIQSLKNKFRKNRRLYLQYLGDEIIEMTHLSSPFIILSEPSCHCPLYFWLLHSCILSSKLLNPSTLKSYCSLKVSEHLTYSTLMSFCPRLSEPFHNHFLLVQCRHLLAELSGQKMTKDDAAIWRCPAMQPLFLSSDSLSPVPLLCTSLRPVPLLCLSKPCPFCVSLRPV